MTHLLLNIVFIILASVGFKSTTEELVVIRDIALPQLVTMSDEQCAELLALYESNEELGSNPLIRKTLEEGDIELNAVLKESKIPGSIGVLTHYFTTPTNAKDGKSIVFNTLFKSLDFNNPKKFYFHQRQKILLSSYNTFIGHNEQGKPAASLFFYQEKDGKIHARNFTLYAGEIPEWLELDNEQ